LGTFLVRFLSSTVAQARGGCLVSDRHGLFSHSCVLARYQHQGRSSTGQVASTVSRQPPLSPAWFQTDTVPVCTVSLSRTFSQLQHGLFSHSSVLTRYQNHLRPGVQVASTVSRQSALPAWFQIDTVPVCTVPFPTFSRSRRRTKAA
jgi:hypothetical protein